MILEPNIMEEPLSETAILHGTHIYRPTHPVRILTATALFDGHDASINIMRRIMQSSGAEIIHLGHNRSASELVNCAIQEDVQGIAITSYQGGHLEYFKYIFDLLNQKGAGHIRIFGGGGGTILPSEIQELQDYGISRIFSPDDGRHFGLQGMINQVIRSCDFSVCTGLDPAGLEQIIDKLKSKEPSAIARLISIAENFPALAGLLSDQIAKAMPAKTPPVLGITGTGGSGKSSLIDELVRRFVNLHPTKTMAIVSVDPSKRRTGGALLGDRIRMNSIDSPNIYMRSLATRQSNLALSRYVQQSIDICKAASFDMIIVETSGIGQSDTEIVEHSDVSLYVMTAEYGAATQLEKIDMLDFADAIAINKFDKRGSQDALRDVSKQYRRNHNDWETEPQNLPIIGTMASQFNDPATTALFELLMGKLDQKTGSTLKDPQTATHTQTATQAYIIPPDRSRYLAEIADLNHQYAQQTQTQAALASKLYQLDGAIKALENLPPDAQNPHNQAAKTTLENISKQEELHLSGAARLALQGWPATQARYQADSYSYQVRGKTIHQDLTDSTLAHLKIPKIALPTYKDWGDIVAWHLNENLPGAFPFAAGVFPLRREGEDPARMFAGEGGPERTNHRFHYLAKGLPSSRLSTAFDSVTLYGNNPEIRPDIFGKIGNSGVNVCSLDDAKKLYSGFDLASPNTSVSMTINGPAPMILAFFLNAAIDQQCEKYIVENGLQNLVETKLKEKFDARGFVRPTYQGSLPTSNNGLGLMLLGLSGAQVLDADVYEQIKNRTLAAVRGTVQADILKEDQAQNTCIFSTEFALRMMGDMQYYFINHRITNFYSVSISGYHIAEAGANPITQLAFTLANGFTFVEYYLSRGMNINDFAPNFSFFFSNGTDAEYAVIGRVARRIWAKAIKEKYKGNERAQKLKYHIQTSGRSLHAQEIAFNDIRTTLQALYALTDNCNSLHTNAYDEAITTPTEESVRRAMAIQLIINKEYGLMKNENALQGSFIIEQLSDMVEAAVLKEFKAISERGGVLGAMERMYQRSRIQEESLYYETLKHDGKLPIVGVNTFLDSKGSPTIIPSEVIRSSNAEKEYAIKAKDDFHKANEKEAILQLNNIKNAALADNNVFEALMQAAPYCSLGQISELLYQVGGQYRRNM